MKKLQTCINLSIWTFKCKPLTKIVERQMRYDDPETSTRLHSTDSDYFISESKVFSFRDVDIVDDVPGENSEEEFVNFWPPPSDI